MRVLFVFLHLATTIMTNLILWHYPIKVFCFVFFNSQESHRHSDYIKQGCNEWTILNTNRHWMLRKTGNLYQVLNECKNVVCFSFSVTGVNQSISVSGTMVCALLSAHCRRFSFSFCRSQFSIINILFICREYLQYVMLIVTYSRKGEIQVAYMYNQNNVESF